MDSARSSDGRPIRSYAGMAGGGRRGAAQQQAHRPTSMAKRNWPSAPSWGRCTTMQASTSTSTRFRFGQSDEAIDFNFEVAKALGCVGITLERSEAMAKKLAPFADKHKIWVAFHNHTNNYPAMDKADRSSTTARPSGSTSMSGTISPAPRDCPRFPCWRNTTTALSACT